MNPPIPVLLVATALLAVLLGGCVDEPASEPTPTTPDASEEAESVKPSLLVDYWQRATFVADAPVCEFGFSGKWRLLRNTGGWVDANHTELVISVEPEDMFSSLGYTGYRVGAYYDHELVFWSDVIKEPTTITYPLDGSQPDIDKDKRWTFFLKRTDPLTEDDPDACTSGLTSGAITITIRAQ